MKRTVIACPWCGRDVQVAIVWWKGKNSMTEGWVAWPEIEPSSIHPCRKVKQ